VFESRILLRQRPGEHAIREIGTVLALGYKATIESRIGGRKEGEKIYNRKMKKGVGPEPSSSSMRGE